MKQHRRVLFWIALIFMVIFAINGIITVSQYLGYASFSGQAGTITQLVIQHEIPTNFWAAMFGVAVRVPGFTNLQFDDFEARDMEENNLLFDCLESETEHEVFATTVNPTTMDITQLFPATAAEVDVAFGRNSSDFDSATNTFTQSLTFEYGGSTINTVGTTTFKLGEENPTTFRMGIAKTSNDTLVFVSIVTNFTDGFNGRLYNYQMLLPAFTNLSTTYYFFSDPNDICPEGEGEGPNKGYVYGSVTNNGGNPLENVIVEVGGVANLTNASGNYSIYTGEGTQNIWAVLTGYDVYRNNVTVVAGNSTRHDIVLTETVVPNPNTGVGPGIDNPGTDVGPAQQEGVGPGQDVGPGEAPLVPITVQQPQVIEGQDVVISLTELNRKLRLGQFLQERIYIYNLRSTTLTVTLDINGSNISRLISVDETELSIEPDAIGEFVLTIYGVGDVGVFNGTLELDGDFNFTVPTILEVLPKDQLPVEALQISIETAQKSYLPNELVRAKTEIRNMLTDQQYPVRLFYTVQSPDGNETIWTHDTNVFVKTSFSMIKNFRLPDDTPAGDYILRVTASYLDLNSATSTIFHVNVPFWQRSLFGLKYWLWILILLVIGAGVGAYFIIRKRIEAKKKYHLKVDYDELPKPGPRSVYVGKIAETDKTTYFKLENFKVHTIVAGSTGGGKSISAQVVVEEALEKGVAVIVFDPTAQWTGMLRPCKDKTMLGLYPLYGMKKTDARAFPGNIRQIKDAREKIDIKKYVKPGEIQVFACHKLDPKDMDMLVANAIRQIFRSGPQEEKLLKVMFVFDEVHRLLPKFGGSGDGFLQIERGCREFRKWGMGIMLVSQVLSDFVGTIKANINTEIQMRTRDEGDLERIRQKYGEDVLRSLVKATVGTGMVENPAYNRGQPYFVAFKPVKHSVERLSDEEIEEYTKYNDDVDNLFYSLDQLEKEGVDVFDLKLELKLAVDKIKSGNFNMVKIYLEGLTPRIDKQWEKIGKKPKQLERELVDQNEMKEELAKAEEERSKYEAANKKDDPAAEKKEWAWKDDVPPDKILNLQNGMMVISLASLYDEVSAMKDDDLDKEFIPEPGEGQEHKNVFADWVKNAIGDTVLANHLYNAKSKEDLVSVLEKKKSGEKLEDVKPPEWVAFREMSGGGKPAEKPAEPAKPVADSSEAPKEQSAEDQKVGQAPPEAEKPVDDAASEQPKPNEQTGETKPGDTESTPENAQQPAAEKPAEAPPAQKPVNAENEAAASTKAESATLSNETQSVEEHENTSEPANATEKPAEVPTSEEQENQQPVETPPAQEQSAAAGGQNAPNHSQEQQAFEELSKAPRQSIDDLVVDDENQAFKLENGVVIYGVKELKEYIPKMDDGIFGKHVGADYNHFADWIKGVFHNEELAGKLQQAHTKDEMLQALN